MSRILQSKFITSAPSVDLAPPPLLAEVVFLGRSNVGKSSLINALLGAKLAKSSSTPGKTQLINFFEAIFERDERPRSYFVDLPGFGYAKVSKSQHNVWQKQLTRFVKNRDSIRIFCHLIDSRHPDLPNDKELRSFIASFQRRDQLYVPILTKSDKLGQKERHVIKTLWGDNVTLVSVSHKKSIDMLRDTITDYLFGKEEICASEC